MVEPETCLKSLSFIDPKTIPRSSYKQGSRPDLLIGVVSSNVDFVVVSIALHAITMEGVRTILDSDYEHTCPGYPRTPTCTY